MKHFNIYLIRHGLSCGNLEQNAIGQPNDSPLADEGVKQANLLSNRFKSEGIEFEKVFCSTYKRAQQTGQIVFPKNKMIYSDALVEYSPGDWRGKDRSVIFSDIKNLERISNLNMGFLFPNGESLNQVERRISTFIETSILYNSEMLDKIKDKKVNIGIVSHGQTIKTMLKSIMGFDSSFVWKIRIENTSITKLKYHPNKGWFLRSLNDTGHLK